MCFLLLLIAGLVAFAQPNPTADSFSGDPSRQLISVQFSDAAGPNQLTSVWVAIGNSEDPQGTCVAALLIQSNTMYVMSDDGSGWEGPVHPGLNNFRGNSRCAVRGEDSSVDISGNTLIWTIKFLFHGGFNGLKPLYGYAARGAAVSGWQFLGPYSVGPLSMSVIDVTPRLGSGLEQTFEAKVTGSYRRSDAAIYFVLTPLSGGSAASCYVRYQPSADMLSLLDNAGAQWIGPVAPGAATSLSNSQCTLNVAQTHVARPGIDRIDWTIPLRFEAAFAGLHPVWMLLDNPPINTSISFLTGQWTVP